MMRIGTKIRMRMVTDSALSFQFWTCQVSFFGWLSQICFGNEFCILQAGSVWNQTWIVWLIILTLDLICRTKPWFQTMIAAFEERSSNHLHSQTIGLFQIPICSYIYFLISPSCRRSDRRQSVDKMNTNEARGDVRFGAWQILTLLVVWVCVKQMGTLNCWMMFDRNTWYYCLIHLPGKTKSGWWFGTCFIFHIVGIMIPTD